MEDGWYFTCVFETVGRWWCHHPSVCSQPVSLNVRWKLFMIKLVKLMKINRITPAPTDCHHKPGEFWKRKPISSESVSLTARPPWCPPGTKTRRQTVMRAKTGNKKLIELNLSVHRDQRGGPGDQVRPDGERGGEDHSVLQPPHQLHRCHPDLL